MGKHKLHINLTILNMSQQKNNFTMRKKAKLIGLTLVLLLAQLNLFGQSEKKVQFFGYSLMQYKHPAQLYSDKYEAYFENLGEHREQGRIVIDETAKTFTVKWLNGDEWVCKYTKTETKNEKDDWYGNVTRTIYTGKWSDNGYDAMLMITVTSSSGCITTVKSRKVVDTDYGIDTWKKIYTFATGGECY